MSKSVEDRFWSKVDKTGDCWEWMASGNKKGYGQFWINGTMVRAHRISLELSGIEVPDDKLVCHTCDNPSCVRPSHLFIGTFTDNNRDTSKKGRHISHNANKTSCYRGHKFTEENTYIRSDNGARICRACDRDRSREKRMRSNGKE